MGPNPPRARDLHRDAAIPVAVDTETSPRDDRKLAAVVAAGTTLQATAATTGMVPRYGASEPRNLRLNLRGCRDTKDAPVPWKSIAETANRGVGLGRCIAYAWIHVCGHIFREDPTVRHSYVSHGTRIFATLFLRNPKNISVTPRL